MVRRSEIRQRRYERSLHPERIGAKFEALKPVMVEMESVYLAQIPLIESKAKQIVEAAGVPSYLVAQYVNVARQCYSLSKRFGQATRDQEGQRVADHWAARGLDGGLLAEVMKICGIEIVAPPEICYNPCVHGMDKHDFELPQAATKELVGIMSNMTGGMELDMGLFRMYRLVAADTWVRTVFIVPHDFTSLISAEVIVWVAADKVGCDIDLSSQYGANLEAYNLHSETDVASTYDFTGMVWNVIDVSSVLTGIAAGDRVALQVTLKEDYNIDFLIHALINVRYS